jgi:hypothetical protein
MNRKAKLGITLTLLSTTMLMMASNLRTAQASPETALHVQPSSIIDPSLTPGTTFTIDIVVSDVEYLYSWQANVSFFPSVLEFINVTEGDFLKDQPEGTWGAKRIENEEGWALIGWSTKGMYVGVSGSGTLATVEFEVLAEGESAIEFGANTLLLGQNSPHPPPNFDDIPFTAEDGYFNNITPIHELIETIESWNLHKGSEKSLIAKLKGAGHMLDMGKEDGAIRKLNVFIDRVQMLRGRTLMDGQADHLMSEAQGIIDLIQG